MQIKNLLIGPSMRFVLNKINPNYFAKFGAVILNKGKENMWLISRSDNIIFGCIITKIFMI